MQLEVLLARQLACRINDHGWHRTTACGLFQQIEAGSVRQPQVQNHAVELAVLQGFETIGRRRRLREFDLRFGQQLANCDP